MNAVVKEMGVVSDENVLRSLDYMGIVDISGSTEKESHRIQGVSRLAEMKEEILRFASVASRYDSDGITFAAFSTGLRVWDGITPDKVDSTFKEFHSGGQTFLELAINAIETKAKSSSKEVVAVIFTDGEATNPNKVIQAIQSLAKATNGRPKVGIVIVQVGTDPEATSFLRMLDDQMKDRGIPDMIACVPVEQAEGLSLQQFVWLARNA